MTQRQHHPATSAVRRGAFAAATALALSLVAATGFAQPGAGPAAGGPGFHHRHGGAGAGDMIPQLLERAKAKLNLNTSQQQMWDNAVAQGKATRGTIRANRLKIHDSLVAELAKTEPDLAAVAAVADGVRQQNLALHTQARGPWLALYATFSPEQKAVVREMLQAKLARAEAFRQRMQDRFGRTGS
jgi:Spy/CpxP family protein refolding chaperone